MTMSDTPDTLVAARYRLVTQLGAGGMGVVWEAWDERLHRRVALKMLRPRPELGDEEREAATRRAMREARISAGLHHPHAVAVFDVVEHEGQPCMVMQLIDSTPLSALLVERGALGPSETSRVGAQIASALAAAHKRRIVHRDVKPGNILIRRDGSAMISDFGISHALGEGTVTATGPLYGTPAYLAPEVARGDASSFASDVFSLGATLYAMLEGRPPFGTDPNPIALLHRVATGDPPAPAHAGPLEPLMLDMLSPDPARRPDMARVASELSDLAGELRPTTDGAASTLVLGAGAGAGAAAPTAVDDEDSEAQPTTVPAAAPIPTPTPPPVPAPAPASRPERPAETAATERADPTPPLFPWMAERRPDAEPDAPAGEPRTERRPRRLVLIGALVAVGLLLIGGVLLLGSLRPDGDAADPAAGGAQDPSESSAPATSSAEPSPEDSPDAAAPSPTPTPTPPAEAPAPPPVSGEQRAVRMLTDYYALMPQGLDAAWPMMTEDYQVNHVGGREAYEEFWGDVASVEIADVTASTPNDAQATLTYTFGDGRVVREVTAYRLVDEGGTLKIAATTVVSSVQL